MEFVTQLWAFKSEEFYLGLHCPELLKNHVWLLLILFKTAIVGCSISHHLYPEMFTDFMQKFSTATVAEHSVEAKGYL